MVSLLDPLKVNDLVLDNRIVLPPMQTQKATEDGKVTDELKEHYAKRSEGQGLIIIEHSYISPEGRLAKKQLGIHRDDLIPGLKELASTVHEKGTPAVVQINHAGKMANRENVGSIPVGPSPDENVRRLKMREVKELVTRFVKAGERAVKAGFDGVEIHGAHGFLLNQFYSPLTNKRNDEYGGTFEKRIKFPLEVVEEVRNKIGEKTLLYRLGSDDLDPEGTQIKHSKKFAKRLAEAGVDIIDVSGGICGSRPEKLEGEQGYFIPQASEIRKSVEIPVIGVGGIKSPEFANKVVENGSVDLVAVGRAQLADPEWAVKTLRKLKN